MVILYLLLYVVACVLFSLAALETRVGRVHAGWAGLAVIAAVWVLQTAQHI